MVCVWPGMLATKVIVAPNSPIALAKPRISPAMIPGAASGKVTVAKTNQDGAPSVCAACSSRASTASIDSRIARTISGKPITAAASAAPVQRKENVNPQQASKSAPEDSLPSEADQQQPAGDHRRQHQRQMHQRVDQRLAGKSPPRQQPGDGHGERQARQRADRGDLEREEYRRPFRRREDQPSLQAAPSATLEARPD